MNEFEKLVQDMRKAQKNYFKNRQTYWLQESKKLESQVDQYLFSINNPKMNFDG